MGRDLHDAFPAARRIFEQADAVLGRALSALCFEGPEAELNRTSNSQPAIFTACMAAFVVAREHGLIEVAPAFVAGHSLGEYMALAAAGALTFEDGLRLVETRGAVTQAAAQATPGGLAAVLGLDEDALAAVCREAGAEVCNINAPGQIVIRGPRDALDVACKLALERGAKRAIPLDVDGAFHTSLMQPAVEPFGEAVSSTQMQEPSAPFIANRTGAPMTDVAAIKDELVFQLTHPVRWVQCVEYMAAHGVTAAVEIGPGKVLTGLIKRIAPAMELRNLNSVAALTA